jgi:hypothetical protein
VIAANRGDNQPSIRQKGAENKARRTGFHRLIGQVTLHVAGQRVGRLIAARTLLLQAFHHDPIQLASQKSRQFGRLRPPRRGDGCQRFAGAQPRARPRRLLLADDTQNLQQGILPQPLAVNRRRAGQQLIEQHTKGIHVRTCVDVQLIQLSLFGRHVLRRADDGAEAGHQAGIGQLRTGGLGHAKVDHLGHRPIVVEGN